MRFHSRKEDVKSDRLFVAFYRSQEMSKAYKVAPLLFSHFSFQTIRVERKVQISLSPENHISEPTLKKL